MEPKKNNQQTGWARQAALIISFGLIIGISLQSLAAGEILIGLYACVAVIYKSDVRLSFGLAILLLLANVGLLMFWPENSYDQKLAIYTFLLLVVGVIQLVLQLRRAPTKVK